MINSKPARELTCTSGAVLECSEVLSKLLMEENQLHHQLNDNIFYFHIFPKNPFNPNTVIRYQLPVTSEVELSVYNVLGQKVATLVSEMKKAGIYNVQWDASGFASGIYYYKLEAGEFRQVRKMLLLR